MMILPVLVLMIGNANAQTTQFTYQGKLSDNGNPANGQYDFQFKLFDMATVGTGTQQGSTVNVPPVTVSAGIFTVQLDFGVSVFPGAARFLEIAVKQTSGSTFTTLGPRQPVTSNPYAIRSLAATAADGLSVACLGCITSSQIQTVQGSQVAGNIAGSQISGTIPVASVPSGSDNYVQNTNTTQASVNFNIGGTGTANILTATMQFNLGGNRILSNAGTNNLFAGGDAGTANTTGNANSFFGQRAGFANTTGVSNSFFGYNAGRNTTGSSNNSFFGDAAGFNNTTGGGSFFGFLAGFNNTTGNENSFFGTYAGFSNTTGVANSFFGDFAGLNHTTGINNSFFGQSAGAGNTTGNSNSFFGDNAGSNNRTGNLNSFFGRDAGFFNTTGSSNVFVGLSTGSGNTTGSNITIIGTSANVGASNLSFATAIGSGAVVSTSNTVVLGRSADTVQIPGALNVSGAFGSNILNAATQFNLGSNRILSAGINNVNLIAGIGAGTVNTGNFNSFFGVDAGGNNTTGSDNSFFGWQAGLFNTTGCCNAFFGLDTGRANTTGGTNSFFGFQAGANNTTGGSNSFFGKTAGSFNTTGSSNTFIGIRADFSTTDTTGTRNTLLGADAKVSTGVSNATAIGNQAQVTQSNSLVLGSINGVNFATADTNVGIGTTAPAFRLHVVNQSNAGLRVETDTAGGTVASFGGNGEFQIDAVNVFGGRFMVKENGRVGIGTAAPDQTLTVNGNASKVGGGSWATFSDERLKNIKGHFTPGLIAVMQLQPLRYEYKRDNALNLRSAAEHVGFSAQAVQKIIPEAVTQNDKGYLLVNNDPIMWTMLNAIKEQQQQIEALKKLVCAEHPNADLCK